MKKTEPVLILLVVCMLTTYSEVGTPTRSKTLVGDCVNLLNLENRRIGTAVVVDKMLYYTDLARMGSAPSFIVAYDLRESRRRWIAITPEEPYTPLVLSDGRLYYLDDLASVLTALSLENGQPLWSVALPMGEYKYWSEIVGGGSLVFVAGVRQLYAFDAMNGEIIWEHIIEADSVVNRASGPFTVGSKLVEYSALTYQEGILYVRTCGHHSDPLKAACSLLAFNAMNGEVEWRFSFDVPLILSEGAEVAATRPAFDESQVLFGAWGGQVFLLERRTGELIWRRELWFPTSRPLLTSSIALLTGPSSIVGIDADANKIAWSIELSNEVVVSPLQLRANDEAFFLLASVSGERELVAINPITGNVVSQRSILNEEMRGIITAFEIDSSKAYVVTEHAVCEFGIP